jgi:hypothetical protein
VWAVHYAFYEKVNDLKNPEDDIKPRKIKSGLTFNEATEYVSLFSDLNWKLCIKPDS